MDLNTGMKKISLLFVAFIIISTATAQTFRNYKIKAEYMYGTILKHNEYLKDLVNGPSQGGEIAVEFQTMGEKNWHQYLNFPVIGFGAIFMDFSDPNMLGQGIGLYPYLNIPLIRTRYLSLNLKPGAGISYITKYYGNTPHTSETSLKGSNGAIGSALNVFFKRRSKYRSTSNLWFQSYCRLFMEPYIKRQHRSAKFRNKYDECVCRIKVLS